MLATLVPAIVLAATFLITVELVHALGRAINNLFFAGDE